jgi:hypothetical protein
MFAAYEEETASGRANPPVSCCKADDGLQDECDNWVR